MFKPREGKTVSALSIGAYINKHRNESLTHEQTILLGDFVRHCYRGTLSRLFNAEIGDLENFFPQFYGVQATLSHNAEVVNSRFRAGEYGVHIGGNSVPNEENIQALIQALERLAGLKTQVIAIKTLQEEDALAPGGPTNS
jgi:hypothetical protein